MVSCYIVGPGDKAPVHTSGDTGIGDIMFNNGLVPDEDLPDEERRARILRDQNIHTVGKPGVISRAYQLAFSVYKAEGLPPESKAFVAIRCMGVVLKTHTVESTENPAFQTTLLFPVYAPFLNDNVTVKVWNYLFGRANQCIAQVCDDYGLSSVFNLENLLKLGQEIGTRWYNLYSVREDHRSIYGNRTQEGKEFAGRVLMRVSMLPTDNPQLGVVRSVIGREPASAPYILIVSVHELRNAIGLGEKISVQASVGRKAGSYSVCPRFLKDSSAYIWDAFEDQTLEPVEETFPVQPEQCPDIFLYLWNEEKGLLLNNTRTLVGYARLKAKDCMGESPEPRWVTTKAIRPGGDSPGELLCTVQFALKGSEAHIGPVEHEVGTFRLVTRIKSGFFMAPQIQNEADLTFYVEIKVGRNKEHVTERARGRYPVWYMRHVFIWDRNFVKEKRLRLKKELQHEGDLVVTVYNERSGIFGAKSEPLGQFAIKLSNLQATKIRLKREDVTEGYFHEFYNVVKDSHVNGRLLAFFDLEPCLEEGPGSVLAVTAAENPVPTKGTLTEGSIRRLNNMTLESRITITVLGLRNLGSKARKPTLTFRLTNDPKKEEHVLNINEERVKSQEPTENPYFLNTIQFDTALSDMYIDWPFLEVELKDESWRGCASGHTTLLLLPYADYVSEADMKATLNTFNTGVETSKTRTIAGSTRKGSSCSRLSSRCSRSHSGSHRSSSRSSHSAVSSVVSPRSGSQSDSDESSSALSVVDEEAKEEDGTEKVDEQPESVIRTEKEKEPSIKLSRISIMGDNEQQQSAGGNKAIITIAEEDKILAADEVRK